MDILKKICITGILVILVISNFIAYNKLYSLGDESEKSKLIMTTVFQLINEGKNINDIEKIEVKYDPYKGGKSPYNSYVTIKSEPYVQIYSWINENKEQVELIGHTGAINK